MDTFRYTESRAQSDSDIIEQKNRTKEICLKYKKVANRLLGIHLTRHEVDCFEKLDDKR